MFYTMRRSLFRFTPHVEILLPVHSSNSLMVLGRTTDPEPVKALQEVNRRVSLNQAFKRIFNLTVWVLISRKLLRGSCSGSARLADTILHRFYKVMGSFSSLNRRYNFFSMKPFISRFSNVIFCYNLFVLGKLCVHFFHLLDVTRLHARYCISPLLLFHCSYELPDGRQVWRFVSFAFFIKFDI
jgi:hypothetical protein